MDPSYDSTHEGKNGCITGEVTKRFVKWIQLMRVLIFPVFKDTPVKAAANSALHGTVYLDKFKNKESGNQWFLRPMISFFSTPNQRPIGIARAKWETS